MKDELEKFISNNRDSLDTETPDADVLNRILARIQPKVEQKPKGIVIPFRVLQWAAACLIFIVGGSIFWVRQKPKDKNSVVAAADVKKQELFVGLSNMESTAGRITTVSNLGQMSNNGNDVVDALVQTLNTDPSPNVRLAALDGLARFYQENYVRKQLAGSLKKQQDPIVQIALIKLLTQIRATGIQQELEQLAGNENNIQEVRDYAYSSLFTLKSS